MLDELIVEVYHQRYVGHVWVDPVPALGSGSTLRWRFSRCGRFVAEFPALPTDTPDAVRSRLQATLDRIHGRQAHSPHPH